MGAPEGDAADGGGPEVGGALVDGRQRAQELPSEIGISLPNNQRQHRKLHIKEHVLPYALC